jgi:hypothetical protein
MNLQSCPAVSSHGQVEFNLERRSGANNFGVISTSAALLKLRRAVPHRGRLKRPKFQGGGKCLTERHVRQVRIAELCLNAIHCANDFRKGLIHVVGRAALESFHRVVQRPQLAKRLFNLALPSAAFLGSSYEYRSYDRQSRTDPSADDASDEGKNGVALRAAGETRAKYTSTGARRRGSACKNPFSRQIDLSRASADACADDCSAIVDG